MTLNPKWGIYLSLISAFLIFTAGASTQLTDLFSPEIAHKIVSACIYFGGAIAAINGVLHMIPSQTGAAAAAQFPLGPKP
jgi:hypothetical protein